MKIGSILLAIIISLSTLTAQPAHALSSADIVLEVSTPVSLFSAPNVASNEPPLNTGDRVTWNGAWSWDGNQFWLPITSLGRERWVAPPDNAMYPQDPSRITNGIDLSTVVRISANNVTLYNQPSHGSSVVGQLNVGSSFTVKAGPVSAELFVWWQVEANGITGWLRDEGARNFEVTQRLRVHNMDVCDGFNITQFGVSGYDSIVPQLPNFIPVDQAIVCIASTNFKGDKTPTVVILSHRETPTPQDTLWLFAQQGGAWNPLYQEVGPEFARTERLFAADLGAEGRPMILWMLRNDGTGGYFQLKVLHFNTTTYTVANILDTSTLDTTKGSIQVSTGTLVILNATFSSANVPNCCPDGLNRVGYTWQGDAFVQTTQGPLRMPSFLQGVPNG